MQAPDLTPAERLILANQYQLLSLLDETNIGGAEKAEILRRGWTGLYGRIFDNLAEEVPTEVTQEIQEILHMFETIEQQLASLPAEQKQQLDLNSLTFQGFDANHDPHYAQLKFMVDTQRLYPDLKGQNLNSRTQMALMKYRAQLPVFLRLEDNMQPYRLADFQKLATA